MGQAMSQILLMLRFVGKGVQLQIWFCKNLIKPKLKALLSQILFQKYKNMEGTMYVSARAFCRVNVARLLAELFTSAN